MTVDISADFNVYILPEKLRELNCSIVVTPANWPN